MKNLFIILTSLFLFCFSYNLSAQQEDDTEVIVVKGIVTDEVGEALIGANVVVKDVPGLGAITDINGRYSIKMEAYHRLIFSYIGYEKKEVLVKTQKVVNVKMKEDTSSVLDEVVITGTGSQKKLTVTGAVTSVNVNDLKSTPSNNITNALAGNVAGIMAMQTTGEPGKNVSEFWIRGISTFGASSSALVLVDGFERDLTDLNIEDIETFQVLKDASETAIYGSRGANGVVLITTKRGKVGKINIDAKVETTYNTRTMTPEYVDGVTYANLMNEARVTRNLAPIFADDELFILQHNLDPDLLPNVDWMDLLLKDGAMSYRASLNMNGGGTNARYFISASYVEDQGMYNTDENLKKDYDTNSNAKRWNYRMNADVDITKTTLLKVGISGSLEKQNNPGHGTAGIWNALVGQTPVSIPVMYSNGLVPASGQNDKTNPWVGATQTGYEETWINRMQSNVTLEQKLDFVTKGLNFIGRFGFDTYNTNWIKHHKWPEQWKAERHRDANGEITFTRIAPAGEMSQSSNGSGDRSEFFEAELHYDRAFANHHLGGVVKYSQDSKIRTYDIGTDLKNSIAIRHQGLSGQVSYNWNYRYFANFNFGYTGSENFATGHRFGFFPAVSGAWNIAEESFIKNNVKWINMFKVRYSWGRAGNDIGGDRFPFLYDISTVDAGYNWGDYNFSKEYKGKQYSRVASTGVTWEVATKHDLGLDLSLFNDKFTMTVDYFHEQRDGIFTSREYLPSMVGLTSSPQANVGSVLSEGFDGNFAYRQRIGKVDLTIRGNITYSKNTILEKDEGYNVYEYQMNKGHRVDQSRGFIALGLFKDYDDIRNSPKQNLGTYQPGDIKYKDVNGDGVVDDNDQVAIGATSRPNMIYGIGASASWNGLDVNIHFQGAGKSTFCIGGNGVYPFADGGWGNVLTDVVKSSRWISADISGDPATEDVNAEYPRLTYGWNNNNYRPSTYWMRNGAYLRLKTVELGYTLPKKIVNKARLNNVRIFCIGTNLLTFSSFKLWDPELQSTNGAAYPLSKSVTLGLTVNL